MSVERWVCMPLSRLVRSVRVNVTADGGSLALTLEHRMLLRIRDTLYEGNWEDFEYDLRARAEGRPHVFDTVPPSQDMRTTIEHHLKMIADMRAWEDRHGRIAADGPNGEDDES